jgi:glycosyltransferase involved in cell wall biosynthesis
MGRPVVATTIGAEGLAATDGHDLLLADTPEASAGAVVSVLTDQTLANRLGAAGRQLADSRYGWGEIGKDMRSRYRSIARTTG